MDWWYIVITVVAWIVAIKMILDEKDDQLCILCHVGDYVGLVLVYTNTRLDLPAKACIGLDWNTNNSNGFIFTI